MNHKALVVIDIQNDITKHYRDIIDRLNAAIEWAAESGMEIVYIQHNNLSAGTRTFKPGTKGAELVPELKIVSDHIFVKTKANALTSEAFSEFIRSKEIREFYITGADATACVKSTCFNMTKAGYAVHVISDCVTSYDLKKMPEMLAYYTDKGCVVRNLATYMGMNYQYRRLDNNNFTGNSLDDFVRHQTVTECWRKTGNDWKLVSHRRHTGHLAVRLRRRSMRNWQQRSPLMSKWNTDYKSIKIFPGNTEWSLNWTGLLIWMWNNTNERRIRWSIIKQLP